MNKPQPPPTPPRVPLGKALDWSEEELSALAEVSPQDTEDAKAWVGKNGRGTGKALWDAQAEDANPTQ